MRSGNRLIAAVFAAFLSAAAGAETPMPTDMPEYIVTAKSPDAAAEEDAVITDMPAPVMTADASFDAASALKQMQAEQKEALKAALTSLLDGQPSQ